jgi:ribose transport system substrate-binding protein
MKSLRKLLSVTLSVVVIGALFSGCSSTKTATPAPSGTTTKENKKIGMILSTLDNPFFVSIQSGATKKAKELGYQLVVANSGNDSTKERSNVDDMVQQGIGLLIINPVDSAAVGNAIAVANDNKIPVITVDRSANTGTVICHIASDNVAGGKMAADFILAQLGGKGNIVELQGTPGASATNDRGKGFHSGVDNKAGVKVVVSQAADFDRQKGLTVMENIIQSTPSFDAIFSHNDEMALGAVKALKAANKKVLVVGFDGSDDAKKAVESGDMAATVAQQPELMGSMAIDNAVKALKGETIPKSIPVDLTLIKK